ncbi:MAG: recombination mediator RecR [Bacillota bacterium]|nr:recombination mediator RecR [Bacillota bacterium]
MARFSRSINRLVAELGRLPGIGQKTAQRLAFYLLSQPEERAYELAAAIADARRETRLCPGCCNLTDQELCDICSDEERDGHVICVVEQPADVAAMERIREYRGRYHVLHGAISPTANIGPRELHISELLQRLQQHPEINEVILANNPTVEGEGTALFIARLLQPSGIRTTRIAHGLPMGTTVEFADEVTLARALAGRQPLN